MAAFSRLLACLVLSGLANAAVVASPADRGAWVSPTLDLSSTYTDVEAIASAARNIQSSKRLSNSASEDPVVPLDLEGYDLTYGPSDAANNAPGYMGFVFLDEYDIEACAAECNKRNADDRGSACQYFNIWRAVVNEKPTTYTCSLYYLPTDASTATNYGQGALKVTLARGYKRRNLLLDGGFESFDKCNDFCYGSETPFWQGSSSPGGVLDASVFHYQPYARTGNAVGVLGSASGIDNLSGVLTVTHPLATAPGKSYQISLFHSSAFAGPSHEGGALFEVLWNGKVVKSVRPGYESWTLYQVEVQATGDDKIALRGGAAPAWSFIDDVTLFVL